MDNKKEKFETENYVHPCIVERAKQLWGEIHDPESIEFQWLIIGAEMGYNYAIYEIQDKLFKMQKRGSDENGK